jgi:pyruvate,water dikinase
MTGVRKLAEIEPGARDTFGGKCFSLATMLRHGLRVPNGICICLDIYRQFVTQTGLLDKIHFELHRKSFDDMRWEELWDAALRIRSMFTETQIPGQIVKQLGQAVRTQFGERPVVVRSSAVGEDSASVSFAGLHESYVNIRGEAGILDHVKLVWASLWSDRALLYRQELGLSVESSAMGVVVQDLVAGECSGIAFSRSPTNPAQAVVEAVYGLNQALVDGTTEPDRWILERDSRAVVSHASASHRGAMIASREGIAMADLAPGQAGHPPLSDAQVVRVLDTALRLESLLGVPQDVEWTLKDDQLYILQARPITTGESTGDDNRSWYLSLTRSYENLKALRARIEAEILPGMDRDASDLAGAPLDSLSESELAEEIERRSAIYDEWMKVYWDECIPFAHGMRLFGQIYNDVVKPDDPHEFVQLLTAEPTISLKRNRLIEHMVNEVRSNATLADALRDGRIPEQSSGFKLLLEQFTRDFGAISLVAVGAHLGVDTAGALPGGIVNLVLEMAKADRAAIAVPAADRDGLVESYLEHFESSRRQFASDLLDLARASSRLRDDDNIHLAGIEAEVKRALELGLRRIAKRKTGISGRPDKDEIVKALKNPSYVPKVVTKPHSRPDAGGQFMIKARQLTGQPAGPGIGQGRARVVVDPSSLFDFKSGEILVCDAIEPEMTFVVPLAAGIVERRGGMLIHGAIIAREYGIPCVTGVPDAISLIKTGDHVTVDGYLGIVIIEKAQSESTLG